MQEHCLLNMGSEVAKFPEIEIREQAGAELGQAQPKLGLDFTLIFCTIKI